MKPAPLDFAGVDFNAPDIAPLIDASNVISALYMMASDIGVVLDQLAKAGPKEVLAPAATHYKALVDLENVLEELRLKAYHMKNFYQMRVLPDLFMNASTKTTKTLNGYTVSWTTDKSVSIPKDAKDGAYQWLVDNGLGDLITSTVNSSTLKATLKEWDRQNKPMPPEDLFTINDLPKYSVTKSSRKIPTV